MPKSSPPLPSAPIMLLIYPINQSSAFNIENLGNFKTKLFFSAVFQTVDPLLDGLVGWSLPSFAPGTGLAGLVMALVGAPEVMVTDYRPRCHIGGHCVGTLTQWPINLLKNAHINLLCPLDSGDITSAWFFFCWAKREVAPTSTQQPPGNFIEKFLFRSKIRPHFTSSSSTVSRPFRSHSFLNPPWTIGGTFFFGASGTGRHFTACFSSNCFSDGFILGPCFFCAFEVTFTRAQTKQGHWTLSRPGGGVSHDGLNNKRVIARKWWCLGKSNEVFTVLNDRSNKFR